MFEDEFMKGKGMGGETLVDLILNKHKLSSEKII